MLPLGIIMISQNTVSTQIESTKKYIAKSSAERARMMVTGIRSAGYLNNMNGGEMGPVIGIGAIYHKSV